MPNHDTDFSELIGPEGPFKNYAESHVPEDHEGPCALAYSDRDGRHWAVFPSRSIAISAAIGACRYDIGGYHDVHVYPIYEAPSNSPNYTNAMDWLFEDDGFEKEDLEGIGVVAIIKKFMQDLARRIANCPKEISNVAWLDLERLLFEVFNALGFKVELTRPAKDGGYDLKLYFEGSIYLIEVKHWSKKKAGKSLIDYFTEVTVSEGAKGLLISTSGFTNKVMMARSEIISERVILGSDIKVVSLCRQYVRAEDGIWVQDSRLREIFFSDTF